MVTYFLSSAILLSFVVASSASYKTVEFTDQFDSSLGVIPAASAIGDTAGGALSYFVWNYFDAGAQSQVQPVTPPNVAAYGEISEATNGQPSWSPVNTSVEYFTQQSLSYACATGTEAISTAVSCTLQATGLRLDGTTVVKELPYDPALLGLDQMNSTTFPETFGPLKSLSIQIVQASISTSLVAAYVDNNHYSAYIKKA